MSNKFVKQGLSAPVNVTWEITYACNSSCIHCLSASGKSRPGELTYDECRYVIDELSGMKVFQLNIGGGEPFLRPDFLDIMDYAHEKGIVTCISTNGTLIDQTIARRLENDLVFLQVSIDGATPQSNDSIRGKGAYDSAIRCLDILGWNGKRLSFNTVLTRMNYNELDKLHDLADRYGVKLRVSRLRPSGLGKVNWSGLNPSRKQLLEFSGWLGGHKDVSTGDSFFSVSSHDRRSLGLDMCGAGKMTCCISPMGEVYPCAFLQERVFLAGKIHETSFAEIWHNSSALKIFRDLEIKGCKDCYRFDHCHGGCPAVAYHTQRSLGHPDPECLVLLLNEKTDPDD